MCLQRFLLLPLHNGGNLNLICSAQSTEKWHCRNLSRKKKSSWYYCTFYSTMVYGTKWGQFSLELHFLMKSYSSTGSVICWLHMRWWTTGPLKYVAADPLIVKCCFLVKTALKFQYFVNTWVVDMLLNVFQPQHIHTDTLPHKQFTTSNYCHYSSNLLIILFQLTVWNLESENNEKYPSQVITYLVLSDTSSLSHWKEKQQIITNLMLELGNIWNKNINK